MKRLLIVVADILLCAALLAGCARAGSADALRLHVIANSDSERDQAVKLMVRDAVLEEIGAGELSCKREAYDYVKSHLEDITKAAQSVLENESYGAKCYLGRFEFPDKDYGGAVYPAGEYDALRVVLGKGEGRNWWCVIFPPLCLATSADIENGQKPQYRSFIADALSGLFGASAIG